MKTLLASIATFLVVTVLFHGTSQAQDPTLERQLETSTNDVSNASNELNDAKKAKESADKALADANATKMTAGQEFNKANEAKVNADKELAQKNTAKSEAGRELEEAQKKLETTDNDENKKKRDDSKAKNEAATNAADTAKVTADKASKATMDAKTKSDDAAAKAEDAKKAAHTAKENADAAAVKLQSATNRLAKTKIVASIKFIHPNARTVIMKFGSPEAFKTLEISERPKTLLIEANKIECDVDGRKWADKEIRITVPSQAKEPIVITIKKLEFLNKNQALITDFPAVPEIALEPNTVALKPTVFGTNNPGTSHLDTPSDSKYSKMLVDKVKRSKLVTYYDHAPAESAMHFSEAFARLAEAAHAAAKSNEGDLQTKGAEVSKKLRDELDAVYSHPGVKLAWKPILVDISNSFYTTVKKNDSGKVSVSVEEAAEIFHQLSDGFHELQEHFTADNERIAIAKATVLGTTQNQSTPSTTADRKRSSSSCVRLLLGF